MTTDHTQDQIKHLEFIQSTISRISNNSFLIKGWSLSIAAALLAFSVKESKWSIAAISLLPSMAFWLLDAYFLRQERLFRRLYDKARLPDPEIEIFSMDVSPYRDSESWVRPIFSTSLLLYYGSLGIANLAALIFIATV